MIIADYHLHSDFSSDCSVSMEQMIQHAIQIGLKKLCFTDHMDIDYPITPEGYTFVFSLADYVRELDRLKAVYASKIDILTGVELGLRSDIPEKLKSFSDSYAFDFIIGSSHLVDEIDPYYSEYWTDKNEEDILIRYFESIIDNCKAFQNFHVYGHLDYIVRYTPRSREYKRILNEKAGHLLEQQDSASQFSYIKSKRTESGSHLMIPGDSSYESYSYNQYKDVIDEVLKTLISYGKGIEINTSGLKYGLGHPHPRKEILSRYLELGGEILTLGSDAHRPEHLAYGFEYAADLLKDLGYRYYTVFEQGKPVMIKLT